MNNKRSIRERILRTSRVRGGEKFTSASLAAWFADVDAFTLRAELNQLAHQGKIAIVKHRAEGHTYQLWAPKAAITMPFLRVPVETLLEGAA